MNSLLPKREIIQVLLTNMDEVSIRSTLSILQQTDLANRLWDLPKDRLLYCVEEGGDTVIAALRRRETEYPLRASPNCYLLIVNAQPDWAELQAMVLQQAEEGRAGGLVHEGEKVQAVYSASPSQLIPGTPNMLELQVAYEIQVEYVEPDPAHEQFGELRHVYSLERAIVWLPSRPHRHALMVLADFSALNPVRRYLEAKLGLRCELPNLSEEMLRLISEGSRPRTATFTSRSDQRQGPLDSATIMVADTDLSATTAFASLRGDRDREQTSGFFSDHPGLQLGGLGVSRRYGKIWTPARLGKAALRRLAGGVIARVERQLAVALDHTLRDFVAYHRNVHVLIGGSRIQGRVRDAFDELVFVILAAQQQPSRRYALSGEQVRTLTKFARPLRLNAIYQIECPTCALQTTAQCPVCGQPCYADWSGEHLGATCSCQQPSSPVEAFSCDCETTVEVGNPANHLFLYPTHELTLAVQQFLEVAGLSLEGMFFLDSASVEVVPHTPLRGPALLSLDDLDLWQRRAKIVYRDPAVANRVLAPVLDHTKEKCYLNGVVTNTERCRECLLTRPPLDRLTGHTLCLPRIFGIPIHMAFDGIHSGAEMADIKYEDTVGDLGRMRFGIHVKSADTSVRRLGRGNERMKGLYAQLGYSIYQVRKGRYPFDVLGISVPQDLHNDDLAALKSMADYAGVRLLVMQRRDWLKVAEAAYEELQF